MWSSIKKPLLAVLLSLFVVEGVLQLAALANERVGLLLSPGIPKGIRDERLGSRGNPALPDHDADGYRNPVVLDQADVVVMGDSQTYGSEVGRHNAWPTLLGGNLGIPVYNMAFGGWGAGQHYSIADQALAKEPRVLVVGIYAGNDFADAYAFATYRDAEALREGAPHDVAHYRAVDEAKGPVNAGWLRTKDARKGRLKTWFNPILEPFGEHFKIYGLIRGLSRIEPPDRVHVKTDSVRDDYENYAAKYAFMPPELMFPFKSGSIGTLFTPTARQPVADRNDPRVVEGVRVTLLAMSKLRDRCGAQCDLLVVAIPTKEYAWGEAVVKAGVDVPEVYGTLVAKEAELWRYFADEFAARGIVAINSTEALRDAIREQKNPYLADWDGHPNIYGNRVIADLVSAHPLLQALVD